MSEARKKLAEAHRIVSERIEDYSSGDRPMSPPVWMLRLSVLIETAEFLIREGEHD